jgi:hypothetical protein
LVSWLIIRRGAGYLSVLCALLLIIGAVLGFLWRVWWGLLFDTPGLAVAGAGFLLGLLGLLLSPTQELRSRDSWPAIAGLVVCVIGIIPFQVGLPIIQWLSPLWDLLVVVILLRFFRYQWGRRVPAWKAWATGSSLWHCWGIVSAVFFSDAAIGLSGLYMLSSMLLWTALQQRLALFHVDFSSIANRYPIPMLILRSAPAVLVVVVIPSTVLFIVNRLFLRRKPPIADARSN